MLANGKYDPKYPDPRTELRLFRAERILLNGEVVEYIAHEDPVRPAVAISVWVLAVALALILNVVNIAAPFPASEPSGSSSPTLSTTTTQASSLVEGFPPDPSLDKYMTPSDNDRSSRIEVSARGWINTLVQSLPSILAALILLLGTGFLIGQLSIWGFSVFMVTNLRIYNRWLDPFPNWHWPEMGEISLDKIPLSRPAPRRPEGPPIGRYGGRRAQKRKWVQTGNVQLADIQDVKTESSISMRLLPKKWRWGKVKVIATGDVPEVESNIPYYLAVVLLLDRICHQPSSADTSHLEDIAQSASRTAAAQEEQLAMFRRLERRQIGAKDE